MTTYNISLNDELAQLVEKQIKINKFANRSEFFRQLLRDFFVTGKNKENTDDDWINDEPYFSELKKRVNELNSGKAKLISSKDFDKEFGF